MNERQRRRLLAHLCAFIVGWSGSGLLVWWLGSDLSEQGRVKLAVALSAIAVIAAVLSVVTRRMARR